MRRRSNLMPVRPLRVVCSTLFVLSVMQGSAAAAPSPDATRRGPLKVRTIDYDAQLDVVRGPVYPYPERLRGRIHVPASGGPFPVIVLVPGRHHACRVAGDDFSIGPVLIGPCPDAPPVIEDHPSWKGFDYLGSNLASHGYLVVTINTNAINVLAPLGGTEERTQLIARTLELVEEWNEGARPISDEVGDALEGKADLARIGLMGHSRGADAVANFLRVEREWGKQREYPGLRAIFQLQGVDIPNLSDAPSGAHVGVLVGSCDADTGLGNVAPWERGRFLPASDRYERVLFHAVGANHNFFNSEWFDEWDPPPTTQPFPLNEYSGNPSCSAARKTNIRLARSDQEKVGLALIGAFLRRYVGGERRFQPLMDGTVGLPSGACPTKSYGAGHPVPCDELVRTSFLAAARDRIVLVQPGGSPRPIQVRGLEVESCGGPDPCPQRTSASVADQLTIRWNGPGRLSVEAGSLDASRFEALTFRTMMNPSDPANRGVTTQNFEVVLTDSRGRAASVRAARYCCALSRPLVDDGTPYEGRDAEGGYRSIHLNGLRMSLTDFDGIDLRRLATIELRFGGVTPRGSVQLAELALQR